MKRLIALALAGATGLAAIGAAQAADTVSLRLKWLTQAQFAGYYAAQRQGFYEEEGLDVTINPIGTDYNPQQALLAGDDVVIDWMPNALANREKGVPTVNIAQPFKKSGMMLTCRKDRGVASPADFKGKTLGVWFGGNEYPFLSWMSKLGLPTDGSPEGVTVVKQGFNVDPILGNPPQAACVSTMTYNEYWQIIDAGIPADQLLVFKYDDQGVATLEDGLYVLEENLKDPAFVDKMARFVRASMKGWAWARENPDEAAAIVVEEDASGAAKEPHQKRMLGEINLLTEGSDGSLDPADYERTVETLLTAGEEPVITKKPEGAWTDVVTKAAGL